MSCPALYEIPLEDDPVLAALREGVALEGCAMVERIQRFYRQSQWGVWCLEAPVEAHQEARRLDLQILSHS